ncbi:MCE family protein [Rhodococcus sp. I2R]|uniref:MCE family protein n=1 Tax=Rhodococcus sp. I2R TaxID=2855445 RepID=UPI001E4B57A2|nr:MCE family protein [Rhodococcus sp. I2R]MCC8926918.1 MCE family protein [Rhodococcus sp. I2R]
MTRCIAKRRCSGVAIRPLVILVLCLTLTSCGWRGLNSLPLPGSAGRGEGSYEIQIEMPNVTTIEPNSRVRVADATVGSVSDIALRNEHALVTVVLEPEVELPANAHAKIGQTSLLGSTHIELAPPVLEPAIGTLAPGDTIPLARAGAFPTTEETLASVSLVLSGGGLAQIGDITDSLDAALTGREDAVRTILAQLDEILTGLDDQKSEIVRAMAGLDSLASEVEQQNTVLSEAIDSLAPALVVLDDRRADLTDALVSLGTLGETANRIVAASGEDLEANLRDLEPVLASLANSGSSLTEYSRYLFTFPFPIDTYQNAVRGDYANGDVTLDLRLETLDNALLLGTPLQGALSGPEAIIGSMQPISLPTIPSLPDLLLPFQGAP